jgi:zinc protease
LNQNTTLDRKKMPAVNAITQIDLPKYDISALRNGSPLYIYNAGTQPVIKIDIIFKGGRWLETKPATAAATIKMMREGTTTRTSAEIADTIDRYAGTLYALDSLESVGFTLYCLQKHLEPLLELTADILQNPIFPDRELQTYIANARQELVIELDKIDTVAYRVATEAVFGSAHPYGYNTSDAMYADLKSEDLAAYFQKNINAEQCTVIASGKIDDSAKALIQQYLGNIKNSGAAQSITYSAPQPSETMEFLQPKKKQMQTAICLIRPLFNRKNPDYAELTILNVLFGGFFGSRLMANIREDKGYTYGIYSAMGKFLFDGYWAISAEVGKKVTQATLKEIHFEMERLRTELVSDAELAMVRNYMMGQYLQQLDGVFSTSGVIRELALNGLELDFYTQLMHAVQNITPQRLQDLANQYLKPSDFKTVLIG